MKIENIITNRHWRKEYFWQIVYEWGDCLSRFLDAPLRKNLLGYRWLRYPWRKIMGTVDNIPISKKLSLAFVMAPWCFDDNVAGKKNIVPAIIDFWLRDDQQIKKFENRYCNNPAVLITSKQVYDFLKEKNVNVNIFHWPLSLPDLWQFRPSTKKYDCVLVGRPSVVLKDWMMQYAAKEKDFTFVYNDRNPSLGMAGRCCYVTSRGEVLGDYYSSRQGYFDLLRASKVGLYSTPSIDGDKQIFNATNSQGYDQLTPRFLEYVAAGCHVIARYPKNSDTDWFKLGDIAPHTATYEEFEEQMDYSRKNPVDSKVYRNWLANHYTSARARSLEKILSILDIV